MSAWRFLAQQISALVLALILVILCDRAAGVFLANTKPQPAPVSEVRLSGYARNWTHPESLPRMREILRRNDILMFGSSELTSRTGVEPYRFLPERLGINILAFGGGGAQSLTILTNLLQHRDLLGPQSRVVVMLSPWWFLAQGTEPSAFQEFTHPTALVQINSDSTLANEFKEPLNRFARRHIHQISPPSLDILLFRFSALQDWGVQSLAKALRINIPEAIREQSWIYQKGLKKQFEMQPETGTSVAVDWPVESARLKQDQIDHSKSNEFGFIDSSWSDYRGTVPRDLKEPDQSDSELKDLEVLVRFLKQQKVPALFIQQPLNTLAYRKLERFDHVKDRIAEIMRDNGMSYIDYLGGKPEREMLVDLAHLSGYGWFKVNQEILAWREKLQ